MTYVKFLLVLSILSFVGLILTNVRIPRARYYNCDIAEFHPDYPAAVKEECRKIRANSKRVTT